jgi:shikimate dehydrogenase
MAHPDRFLLAGVMGWPVMHSRSPKLHNYWLELHGLAGTYVPLAIRPEGIEAALRALPALGFSGCNLTIPHKETALKVVDHADEKARRIGAISCVTVRSDGTLAGTNNDVFGYMENLREAFPEWKSSAGPVAVMGAGGAARAVVYALAEMGVREIRICNRTRGRAERLAQALGVDCTIVDWADRHRALDGVTLLTNTTSQGMVGNPALDLSLERLPRGAHVCDVVYIPGETPLLAAARARGNRVVNGLGMLLHQARPAWRDWFGIEVQVTEDLRRLIEATI